MNSNNLLEIEYANKMLKIEYAIKEAQLKRIQAETQYIIECASFINTQHQIMGQQYYYYPEDTESYKINISEQSESVLNVNMSEQVQSDSNINNINQQSESVQNVAITEQSESVQNVAISEQSESVQNVNTSEQIESVQNVNITEQIESGCNVDISSEIVSEQIECVLNLNVSKQIESVLNIDNKAILSGFKEKLCLNIVNKEDTVNLNLDICTPCDSTDLLQVKPINKRKELTLNYLLQYPKLLNQMCTFKNCTKDKCKFAHSIKTECTYYNNGTCIFPNCKNDHVDRKRKVCITQFIKNKCENNNCQYFHLSDDDLEKFNDKNICIYDLTDDCTNGERCYKTHLKK